MSHGRRRGGCDWFRATRVRLVMDKMRRAPDLEAMLPGMPDAMRDPVAPRFEDSFIALLKGQPPSGRRRVASSCASTGTVIRKGPPMAKRSSKWMSSNAVSATFHAVKSDQLYGQRGARCSACWEPTAPARSTTFRMLCGLLPPTAGSLRVAGEDLRHAAAARRAPASATCLRNFPCTATSASCENLRFFSSAYGLSRQAARDSACSGP